MPGIAARLIIGMEIKDYEHVYVKNSPIHGKGLYAAEPIEAGSFIGTYHGDETDEDGTYVLWLFEDGNQTGRDGKNELRYLNHSHEPNAEFDGYDLYALRDIAPDEEITICYDPENPTAWEDM